MAVAVGGGLSLPAVPPRGRFVRARDVQLQRNVDDSTSSHRDWTGDDRRLTWGFGGAYDDLFGNAQVESEAYVEPSKAESLDRRRAGHHGLGRRAKERRQEAERRSETRDSERRQDRRRCCGRTGSPERIQSDLGQRGFP